MKKIAIIGSGDLGQLISHYATVNNHYGIAGYFDDWQVPKSRIGFGIVLGGTHQVFNFYNRKIFDEIIIAVGYKHFDFRKKIFNKFKGSIPFAKIISPLANIDKTCEIGEGAVILPGCTLDKNVTIGDNVFLNIGCVIAHDSTIQANSFLAPGVNIAGFVNIGQCCFLGIGTTIISRAKLCGYTNTGGGSVVTRDIKKPGYYVGVPARYLNHGVPSIDY